MLLNLSSSSVKMPPLRPYNAAHKWVEFVGEGTKSAPLTKDDDGDGDDGRVRFTYRGSFPPRDYKSWGVMYLDD